jgi:signal transduction histidine kinase
VLGGHAVIYTDAGRSHVAAPLMCREKVTGALTFVAAQARRYTAADLDVVNDLAGRAALSVDNARLYQGAREALASRDEFLSIASHEIRGPLTSIHLAVQGLMRDVLPPDAAQTALEIIEREDRRLGRFVDELLDLTRIRSGQLHFEIEEVDAGTVVRDVVSQMAGETALAGTSVSVTTNGELIGHWDRLRLEQVMTNLLSNAIKFSEGKPVEVIGEHADAHVRVRVIDHGMGIEPAMLERIFDPFERGTGARNAGGLGLGLHIAKVIVDGLGGTISVNSRFGEGAAFTVELPTARNHDHATTVDSRR